MTIDTDTNTDDELKPRFCTRAEAEAEIAAINEEIEWWQDLVKDIERLEEQRDEIEEQLEALDDEERREVFADRIGASSESPYPRELVVIGPRGGTSMQKFELHPFALAFPPLTKAECEMLRASIERDGVVVPILIYQGKILDGRNRAYFAEMFHKPVKIEVFEGTEEEARRLVATRNLHCRHLSPTQVQLVAGELSSDDETVERLHEQQLAAGADLGRPD
jgi:hypothetical protein